MEGMTFNGMRRLGGLGSVMLLGFCCALLSGCQDEADGWKGTIEVHQRGRESAPLMKGDLLARNSGLMLFNIAARNHELSVTVDAKAHVSWIVVHQVRKYLKGSAEEIETDSLYQCAPPLIYACLEKNRFSKVGEETVDGHPCEIYEGRSFYKGQVGTERIWHPTDLPTVYWLKAVEVISADFVLEASLKDVTPQKLDSELFKVPAGYQKLEAQGTPHL